ncbi:Hypothetical_protein [Hexamita inflata]|uniref:Hypothetical_protein n=1 Tax=Hexamita inflata TaxID=28002 RepID=A0AA86UK92_9EUKA|nr:Hypothetical protein HINF_LOCUS30558 [Hexamita inflata]
MDFTEAYNILTQGHANQMWMLQCLQQYAQLQGQYFSNLKPITNAFKQPPYPLQQTSTILNIIPLMEENQKMAENSAKNLPFFIQSVHSIIVQERMHVDDVFRQYNRIAEKIAYLNNQYISSKLELSRLQQEGASGCITCVSALRIAKQDKTCVKWQYMLQNSRERLDLYMQQNKQNIDQLLSNKTEIDKQIQDQVVNGYQQIIKYLGQFDSYQCPKEVTNVLECTGPIFSEELIVAREEAVMDQTKII